MNQLGFYLLLAALLQGIIFRLFLSTTLMAVLSEWNWFPLNVIAPTPVVPLSQDPLLYDNDANYNNASFNPDMMPSMARDYQQHRNASASASQGPPPPGAEDRRSQQAPAPGQQGSDRTGLLLAQQQQQPQPQGTTTPRGPSSSQPNSARGRTQHYGSIDVEAM
jgi:hypothetical protein